MCLHYTLVFADANLLKDSSALMNTANALASSLLAAQLFDDFPCLSFYCLFQNCSYVMPETTCYQNDEVQETSTESDYQEELSSQVNNFPKPI